MINNLFLAHNINNMKNLRKEKILLFIILLIIMIISFFNMQNATLINSTYKNHLTKQIIWYLGGFLILLIIKKINIEKLFKMSFFLYLLALFSLILVLFMGKTINGAKAWFKIGFFSFQPSEFMKLTLTLYLINLVTNTNLKTKKDELLLIFKVLIITLIPSFLVFLEPDTGAIIFYFLIAFCILFFSKISKWWFLLFFLFLILGTITFYYLYNYEQDFLIKMIGTSFFYRIERLLTFTNNNSYQLENALIVIGSAPLIKNGLNKINLYIPEAPTDFIFAFNIGNYGLISGFIILICYFIIDLILIKWLNKTKNKKIKLFLISFISIFFFQQFINIGMNLGIVPIIGIPLPFLSYGGSTIIIYFLFLGIILNLINKEHINNY